MKTGKKEEMETISTTCTSCGNTFERERKRGRPAVKCAPCKSNNQTITQFSKSTGEVVDRAVEVIDGVTWIENAEPCVSCTKTFMRPKKRGRPPTKCPDCQAWDDAEKAAVMTTSDEVLEELFTGPKVLLKGTPEAIPKGAEAQCPPPRGCGRIFTSDSACESHKVYGANGNIAECKDPATLGMQPRERRNLPIWTRPSIKEDVS